MKCISVLSPNYDDRVLPISLIILHYTGMKTGGAALERLCDECAKVSSHYMVEEDGRIFQLVAEEKRAWHAGISSWNGQADVNSMSVGIEIVNGGHDFGLPDFPSAQINAVIDLCKDIMARNTLSAFDVAGHSDIAPARKQDPGEKFPWHLLAKHNIGYWPDVASHDKRVLFEKNARDRGVSIVQSGLGYLGYGVEVSGILDEKTQLVVAAFQRRYRQDQIDGQIDGQTMEILTSLANAKKKIEKAEAHQS